MMQPSPPTRPTTDDILQCPFPGNSRSLATSRMLAPKLKVINNIYIGIKKYFPHNKRFTLVSVHARCVIKVFESMHI